MKKLSLLAIPVLAAAVAYWSINGTRTVTREKTAQVEQFLSRLVADTLEEDYKRHGIIITARVTNMAIDRIAREETREFIFYAVRGRVSYRIQGKRQWRDQEGNRIQLGPETEISHWFGCGVMEDRYGDLLKDRKNRLTFYAEKPEE